MEAKSTPASIDENGNFPTICVASQWKSAPYVVQMERTVAIGLMTPVSLFAAITGPQCAHRFATDFSSSSVSSTPSPSTPT